MMKKGGLIFTAVVMVGLLALNSLAAPADDAKAAADNPSKLMGLLKGKSAADAAGILTETVKAAIAKGGDERAIKKRLADIVAWAIPASKGNAPAVAGALVKAAGDKYMTVVVASVATAAAAVTDAPKSIVDAAIAAAGADNAKDAKDAAGNPAQTLGGLTKRRVERTAKRAAAILSGKPMGAKLPTTTTTTTTTTVAKTKKVEAPAPAPVVPRRRPKPPVTPVGKQ